MSEITELTKIDFSYVFIAVFVILIGIKVIVSLFEWISDKLGLETKWMRKRREEHELLLRTSQRLTALQEQYNRDIRTSNTCTDMQINNLMAAQREILADKINDKYKYYICIPLTKVWAAITAETQNMNTASITCTSYRWKQN